MTMTLDTVQTILVASIKGGVGKSTTVAATAEMIATAGRRGRRVLAIDGDPQGNLTADDFGVTGDGGKSLAETLQYGSPLRPVEGVRTNLDLISGGPHLSVAGAQAHLTPESRANMVDNFQTQLSILCESKRYDLVLIDSGPGDVPLVDTYLSVANYLLIPTKADQGSIGGVERLAKRFLRVRKDGATIELLGVLLFDVNPRAERRNGAAVEQISEMLEGSGSSPFEVHIRSAQAEAYDMRALHLTAGELALQAPQMPRSSTWSRDPAGLAADYQKLVSEIIGRLLQFGAAQDRRSQAAERVG
ncbi:chromosome partitioning protein ParA [Mycobacteroides chelonae]|uniref:Chromosome partitioning protein ParA n=1 Tax=Mycobacteroides chelonae TaxID=1774 RepID=A0A1S1LQ67_MYCCH|nr:ParA family protein [Mycobacteroides chelonae]OHU57083.1 chromosome partitioning protein ParA [Mycobacteroides chelonae]